MAAPLLGDVATPMECADIGGDAGSDAPQAAISVFPAWVTTFVCNERSGAWLLLWLACVVSIVVLALQIAIPSTA